MAARGLDIGGLPYMISVTMPPSEEKQTYVHRIGRVGRAERMGLAIALVSKFKEKVGQSLKIYYHNVAIVLHSHSTRRVESSYF